MGVITENTAALQAASGITETLYTICPVLVASNVAVELGWLDEEFKKAGASARYLRSLTGPKDWLPHYNHDSDRLIRDGGNSPAVGAKADVRPTTLVGLTQAQPAGKIIVRVDSGINKVADLKGRRVALYRSGLTDKLDHRRATSEHGLLAALDLHGLGRSDVIWTDVVDGENDAFHDRQPASRPSELWARRCAADSGFRWTSEAQALQDGVADAYYDYSVGIAASLEKSGKFKVIEDLDRYPDWTLRIANAPRTITVSTEFAERHPEVVVAFLRTAIRAGRWINANPEAASEIFQRVTVYPCAKGIAKALKQYDLVPNLSARNLAGLEVEKDFLLQHDYIRNDFDVHQWADHRYLDEALKGL